MNEGPDKIEIDTDLLEIWATTKQLVEWARDTWRMMSETDKIHGFRVIEAKTREHVLHVSRYTVSRGLRVYEIKRGGRKDGL